MIDDAYKDRAPTRSKSALGPVGDSRVEDFK